MRHYVCIYAFTVLLLNCLCTNAQQTFGSLRGVVLDPTGAAVSGATITVENTETHARITATTDQTGQYTLNQLAPGKYDITAQLTGFSVTRVQNVVVGTGQTTPLNLTLSPSGGGRGPGGIQGVAPISPGGGNQGAAPTSPGGGNQGAAPTAPVASGPRFVRNDYTPCLFRQEDYLAFLQGLQPASGGQGQPALLVISCSQSLLTWKEANDIFGRRIADDYLAIQVVIRNLDPDHEFLVHDVQVASGVPRGSQVSHPFTPINGTSADGTTTLKLTSKTIREWQFRPGGFITCSGGSGGWTSINDTLAITEVDSKNNSITLPITVEGAIPQGITCMGDVSDPAVWFAAGRDRNLVRGVALKGQAYDRRNMLIHIGEAIGDIASAASVAFTSLDFKNGVSVYRAAFLPGMERIFPDFTIDQLNRLNDLTFSANTAYKIVVPKNGAVPFVTFVPAKIYADGYKKYSQDELRNLMNHMLVIFSGVHITPTNDHATVQSFTCPSKDGYIDLSKDPVTCKLAADNLSALASVRLVSSSQASEAPVQASVSTDGSVNFKADDLKKLNSPVYQVHVVDKNGRDQTTDFTIKILPNVSGATGKCDATAHTCSLTLQGSNLGAIAQVLADCGSGSPSFGVPDPSAAGQFRLNYEVKGKTGCKIKIHVGDQDIDTGSKVDFK
jgi:hypothetical protein